MIWSMLLTAFTEPGQIPFELKGPELEDNQLYLLRKMNFQQIKNPLEQQNSKVNVFHAVLVDHVETKNKRGFYGKPRYCKTCKAYKPDRCHHCSVCNKCVLKMDHHVQNKINKCPFINNCIGFFNYKYFLLMIMYSFCMLSMIIITIQQEFIKIINDCQQLFQKCLIIIFVYALILLIFFAIGLFFFFHVLICKSLTTIEFREKMSQNYDVSPYNQSVLYNLKMIFGSNPLYWFFPLKPNYEGDGMVFKRTKKVKKVSRIQTPKQNNAIILDIQ